jgi:Na+-translocating ferredoxin:NAD+ oxidoreductase RNF subunit RnfB
VSGATVLLAVAILAGVGLVFAGLIALTHRKFKVWEDPRIDVVTGMLPGANCGACGQPGCRAFAELMVGGKVQPGGCNVMSDEQIASVASYLGVEAGAVSRRVARLLCAGGRDVTVQQADYLGFTTCKAAAAVAGGGKGCAWGCLGYGDCAVACDFDAIVMNAQELPVVSLTKCTACGDCVDACPKDLFTIMPLEHQLIVQCRSLLEGDAIQAVCRVACTACGKCVIDAAPGLIQISHGLAVVDYEQYARATPAATARCPTGAIVWLEGAQFQPLRHSEPTEMAVA